jgi:superfamily II DNA helicase RecQ
VHKSALVCSVEEDIVDYVATQHGGTGIVYCHKKATVEEIAHELKLAGIAAAPFHGSMNAKAKEQTLAAWLHGDLQVRGLDDAVVIATVVDDRHSWLAAHSCERRGLCARTVHSTDETG